MDSAIVASIIGTLGAAFITVLIYFLLSLRDGIRAVDARIDKMGSGLESRLGARIDKVESRLTTIDEKLVRIEATQEEHGRLLVGMAGHGERIAAVEGAVAAMP